MAKREKKSNPCEAPKTRPLRGAKNRIQTSSSASADFLLEAEKRGSPPKSEKAAAFWRVGGAGRGVQPFLRKESSESNKQNDESCADSHNLDCHESANTDSHTKNINHILNIFHQICQIPHPSGKTKDLQKFLVDFLESCDCKIQTDSTGNIHAIKGESKLIFQAHYDMVLVGQKIELFIENGFLKSRDSSLGADNGIAIALLLHFAKKRKNIEILLTNDEEIGMLGAKNLALHTQSKIMINLDSECVNEICVGCAGGFDADIALDSAIPNQSNPQNLKNATFYELQAQNFKGGHSGIDIDKNIPNAIVELLWELESLRKMGEFSIIEIHGGENRNSIPINARAVIAANTPISSLRDSRSESKQSTNPHIVITKLKSYRLDSRHSPMPSEIIPHLLNLHNGIYEMQGGSVTSSLNFSLISNESLKIMVRANSAELLHRHATRLKSLFGANVAFSGFYNAWEREDSPIVAKLQQLYAKHKIPHKIVQIHAGLECGILKEKCALREVVSIGPTIFHPHSKGESLDLASVGKIYDILYDLIPN